MIRKETNKSTNEQTDKVNVKEVESIIVKVGGDM